MGKDLRFVTLLFLSFVINDSFSFLVNRRAREAVHATSFASSQTDEETLEAVKENLFELILSTPSNAPTSKQKTSEIISIATKLEALCPTPEDEVLPKLAGNWELLWTAQDLTDEDLGLGLLRKWINPLENQAYSNNPNSSTGRGRSNPVLPRPIQDRLETIGLIGQDVDPVKSSQSIDLRKKQVRNVVAFTIPSPGGGRKATLTVTVGFTPNSTDERQIDVKFQSCRVAVQKTPINFDIPLGPIGPTGWLRTFYIDDKLRITKGHKGSIFILTRP